MVNIHHPCASGVGDLARRSFVLYTLAKNGHHIAHIYFQFPLRDFLRRAHKISCELLGKLEAPVSSSEVHVSDELIGAPMSSSEA